MRAIVLKVVDEGRAHIRDIREGRRADVQRARLGLERQREELDRLIGHRLYKRGDRLLHHLIEFVLFQVLGGAWAERHARRGRWRLGRRRSRLLAKHPRHVQQWCTSTLGLLLQRAVDRLSEPIGNLVLLRIRLCLLDAHRCHAKGADALR